MTAANSKTLQDIGEIKLIDEIIIPLAKRYEADAPLGDDCCYLPVSENLLAVTTDVGPRPLVQSLPSYNNDYESAGWHAAVATASDIATTGASPLFLTNCIDAPAELPVSTFIEFLEGYFRACATFGFRNAGGDVRHGPVLSIRVCGGGLLKYGRRIGRGGAKPGDHLILIGDAGKFMATYLLARNGDSSVIPSGKLTDEAASTLRFPEPSLREMQILAKHDLIVAASDSSDGLLGAINNIARGSQCGFELNLRESLISPIVRSAAEAANYDPWNVFFCWGDWSVAAAIEEEHYNEFQRICADEQIDWIDIGRAIDPPQRLVARLPEGLVDINIVQNENFITRGFNAGIEGHLDYMLLTNLFIGKNE